MRRVVILMVVTMVPALVRAESVLCLPGTTDHDWNYENAEMVFWGEIVGAMRSDSWSGEYGDIAFTDRDVYLEFAWTLTFGVDLLWKGQTDERVTVDLGTDSIWPEIGERFLVYVFDDDGRLWSSIHCGKMKLVDRSEAMKIAGDDFQDLWTDRLDQAELELLGEPE